MKDDLVGYLLGALEPEEHEKVQRALETDSEAREHLETLRGSLSLLESDQEHHAPPFGLAHRTCALIDQRSQAGIEVGGAVNEGGWRLRDVVVAAGTCIAASLILMVAVDASRRQVQRVKCADNQRILHLALANYSDLHNGYFPFVAAEGPSPLAVNGVYAPTLVESGQVTDTSVFLCPSAAHTPPKPTPTRAQLLALSESDPKLPSLCRDMGGSYGYAFGYVDEKSGVYRGRHNEQSPYRVLLADQPPRSANEARRANSPNHGGQGQNVLYEDGHVQFMTDPSRGSEDNIYVNYRGEMSAGIGQDDSVIGYSELRPF